MGVEPTYSHQAMPGITELLLVHMVGRGGVEPPFSVFQTGTPTVYVTVPFLISRRIVLGLTS